MALINTTTTGILGTTVYGDGAGALTVQQDGVQIAKVTKSPIFSASQSSTQTITVNSFNKLLFQTEEFDSDNCYDTSLSRFTPTIAGYYYFSCAWQSATQGSALANTYTSIFKNGSRYKDVEVNLAAINSVQIVGQTFGLVYLNGSTDYVEVYVYQGSNGSGVATAAESLRTWFSGYLVKAA